MRQLLLLISCMTGMLAIPSAGQAVQFPNVPVSQQPGYPIPTDYTYVLCNKGGGSAILSSFQVGLPDWQGISNVQSPPGWTWSIVTAENSDWVATPDGQVAPGPWSAVPTAIQWTDPSGTLLAPTNTLTFGFNDPNPYVDVTWSDNLVPHGDEYDPVAGSAGVYTFGPVHAPIPEPSSLILLGAGAVSLLFYAWRRRTA
jgi:hypothetical protein